MIVSLTTVILHVSAACQLIKKVNTYLADAFFGLLNICISSSGAVNHPPHLGVHGISLEGVHRFGAHLVVHCRVQHCTVRQIRLLG